MQKHIERITPTKDNLEQFFKEFPDHKQRYDFAINFLNKDMDVADIACGVGYGSFLMSQYCKSVKGFDISDEAITHAKKNFKMDNIEFYNCLYNEIVNYRFDFVCSFETIEHMDEEAGDLFLLKILKSLKPKGRLLISTPINKSKIKTNLTPYHIREYDDIEFKQKLIKNGFTIISMFGQGDSKYYNKLYGKNILNFSMFDIMRTGIHETV